MAFSDPWPTSLIFVSAQVRLLTCYGPLPLPFNGFEAAVSAPCGRVANALFVACLSSALGGVWPFSDPWPTSFIFVSVQVRLLTCYGPLPVFFNGFEAAVSAPCGRVANALFVACRSSALGGVWPFRIRGQRA